MSRYLFNITLFLIITIAVTDAAGQGDKRVIQFSGIVTAEDSISNGIAGVHIYTPTAGRGTTTNAYGYFSMPALEGDSLIISAVSYERQYFVIPKGKSESYTVIIQLTRDTTYLPELEVFPYPTEELFKEAILALELPNQRDIDNLRRNLDEAMLRKMFAQMGMSARANHTYYMQQQQRAWYNRYQITNANPLLNPFAWARFIRSIKRGDLKKKKK